MPRPRKGESRKKFMTRAIPVILEEEPEKTRAQAAGKAGGMFDFYKKKQRASTRKRKK